MDRALTGEAQFAGQHRLAFQPIVVFKIEEWDINDIKFSRSRGKNQARTGMKQWLPCIFASQLGRHIDAAK